MLIHGREEARLAGAAVGSRRAHILYGVVLLSGLRRVWCSTQRGRYGQRSGKLGGKGGKARPGQASRTERRG